MKHVSCCTNESCFSWVIHTCLDIQYPCLQSLAVFLGKKTTWCLCGKYNGREAFFTWGVAPIQTVLQSFGSLHDHEDVRTFESFLHYWPFVKIIHQLLVDSPHKVPVMLGFDVFFGVMVLAKPAVAYIAELPVTETPWRQSEITVISFQLGIWNMCVMCIGPS